MRSSSLLGMQLGSSVQSWYQAIKRDPTEAMLALIRVNDANQMYRQLLKPDPPRGSGNWRCDLCQADFARKNSLSVHQVTVHRRKRRARPYVWTRQCQCCLAIYPTR